jgi:hypothetical protein
MSLRDGLRRRRLNGDLAGIRGAGRGMPLAELRNEQSIRLD